MLLLHYCIVYIDYCIGLLLIFYKSSIDLYCFLLICIQYITVLIFEINFRIEKSLWKPFKVKNEKYV